MLTATAVSTSKQAIATTRYLSMPNHASDPRSLEWDNDEGLDPVCDSYSSFTVSPHLSLSIETLFLIDVVLCLTANTLAQSQNILQ
jgi:hypothetical protein